MRSIEEVRTYFLNLFDHAAKRSSMYGGELFLHNCLNHLAFVDQTESILQREMQRLKDWGAYNACGATGAFKCATGISQPEMEVASLYAELAFRMGYLQLDRYLSPKEFQMCRQRIDRKFSERDWAVDEIKMEFGKPSWATGTNPYYPCVLAYASAEVSDGWVFFDFWNEFASTKSSHVIGKYGPAPMLRYIRRPAVSFRKSFIRTAFAKRHFHRKRARPSS